MLPPSMQSVPILSDTLRFQPRALEDVRVRQPCVNKHFRPLNTRFPCTHWHAYVYVSSTLMC